MDFISLVFLSDVYVCLPLTIVFLCCVAQRDRAHIIYYTNLLVSNIMQISARITWLSNPSSAGGNIATVVYFIGVMASVYFKLCIATERYSLIACPLLDCIRQIKSSLLVSALVWAFCVITVTPAVVFEQFILPPFFALLPAPLFILCLAGTLKALPAATSVSTEEKRRTVGTFVLLLLNYFLMIFQTWVIWGLVYLENWSIHLHHIYFYIVLTFFLLSPLLDLILFVFMRKGCIDKLLECLCCCKMNSTASSVSITSV